MTKIKICGLKRKEDIQYVNQLQPDYVGFVFARSSRQVDLNWARELVKDLDQQIKKVGIFQNMKKEEVDAVAEGCGLDVLQFHGDEEPDYCKAFQRQVWKAFRIKDKVSFRQMQQYTVAGYLLDTYTGGQYGGSGKTFPWEMAVSIRRRGLWIVAGGLHAGNVGEAIRILKPDIVDVSSGVEENGIKDFNKMKNFIENVRR
ncbi:phosphoribosylanthranilate isomerase [Geosporobacter ferrireducens]|uniref:N-(5'-phosphoribosyl)anthranilate isomerase n=1 Tax=Geosporobacter ferrireducens TaxID=1424294 RepID=A0A1D8GEE9_9FIRM|nr:phosphoribosylanthranilate isomerase [Geosporobacter ferrireducens]AOT69258.1 N-(5'-phosphoribosyl)anthranilate isomerase [Geosporobacter ferrireducens]MTI56940.1 phosphoribosylanthranilate isomerase [Geosporobacter ferrireducens]